MFCYHERFRCGRSLLVYPSTSATTHLGDAGIFVDRNHRCTLAFLAVDGDPRADVAQLLHGHATAP
jgi:hypothetical protein